MSPELIPTPFQTRIDMAVIHAQTALNFVAEAATADSAEARSIWHTHARNAISKCIDRLEDRWDTV